MKKLLSFALLTLSVGLWAETVEYRYPVYNDNDAAKGIKEWQTGSADATEITNASTTLATGWYVVKGTDVQTGTLTCQGAVHIILADGAKLTATGGESQAGIQVSGTGYTLKIYGQTNQSGQLIANGGLYAAGIGGGEDESGTNITINGGKVTATGGEYAACIGGGSKGDGSNIIINGGEVTAICAYNNCGAGIGGGYYGAGSNITINGGKVTATGKGNAAGIGGSGKQLNTQTETCSNITINGGKVTATSEGSGAGIGGGCREFASNIRINGGEVTATGGNVNASGIGNGASVVIATGTSTNIFVATTLIVKAGATENPTEEIAVDRTDDTDIASSLKGKKYVTMVTCVPYIDEKGKEQKVAASEVTFSSDQVTWNAGWYVVKGEDVQLSKGAVCQGAVHLILADGAKLTAKGEQFKAGIQVSGDGNSLAIYGQANQSGQLTATGGDNAAGIGGGKNAAGSNITINGGIVTAQGVIRGAGIGGGLSGQGSNIIINGGKVTATGGSYSPPGSGTGTGIGTGISTIIDFGGDTDQGAAGIGGGSNGMGSNININGGEVIATGGKEGAGIGSGYLKNSFNITINGGKVIATGGNDGAGIGGGNEGDGSNITITGGEVTAIGGVNAAGIGGGNNKKGSYITIKDGIVTAQGGNGGAGIGGGNKEKSEDQKDNSNITIHGGTVTATGGENGAGIGGGNWSNGSYITINGGIVTATGRNEAAGIGGGNHEKGFDITINGGKVIATGGTGVNLYTETEGIGSSYYGSGSYNIKVAINLIVEAGNDVNTTEVIAPTRKANEDHAQYLHKKRYVTITDPLPAIKEAAIADINNVAAAAKEEIDGLGVDESAKSDAKAEIDNIVNTVKQTINAATSKDAIDNAKTQAIADIHNVVQTTKNMWVTLRTDVTANDWNTICMERNITAIDGATFWNVVSETDAAFTLEQVEAPVPAGYGYIIRYTATELKVKYGSEVAQTPVTATQEHPIQGIFEAITDCNQTTGENALTGNYVVYQNKLCKVTGWVTMADHRAYVIAGEAPSKAPAPNGAPRMTMAKPNSTPTGLGQSAITNHKSAMKVIKDGRFMIVRDNKMYTIMGVEE